MWVTDGIHAEYVNIDSINPNGALNIRWLHNSKIKQLAKVDHVPLSYMVLSVLRYMHMPNALFVGYNCTL